MISRSILGYQPYPLDIYSLHMMQMRIKMMTTLAFWKMVL